MTDPVEPVWAALRTFTPARIGVGRAGCSQTCRSHLQFQRDHARARDAVLAPLDVDGLIRALALPVVVVESAAGDRGTYLQRPDLGRELRASDREQLRSLAGDADTRFDLALVIGDGLSALAVQRQVPGFLSALLPLLQNWRLAPVVVATQARVALADDVGSALGARMSLLLIGERPGLSAADSLGAYLTWAPQPGRRDAERNCISNIRPEGLDPAAAAQTCAYLIGVALRSCQTGIDLKDHSQTLENTSDLRIPFLRPALPE